MDRGFNPTLAISLFESADVTTQIINGQLASEQSQAQSQTRMGYMGHLTLIAEEVVKFTERHPPELLSETVLDKVMSQDWINYVEGALAETRERDNAILGGVRPEVAMNNRPPGAGLAAVGLSGLGSALGLASQGASSALVEAGLNGSLDMHGNGDGGAGPFSISAGISSGFHSSSDEDEDEADENDEDVNNEVSRSLVRASFISFSRRRLLGADEGLLLDEERVAVEHVKDVNPELQPLSQHELSTSADGQGPFRDENSSEDDVDSEYDILNECSHELAYNMGQPIHGSEEDLNLARFWRDMASRLRPRR